MTFDTKQTACFLLLLLASSGFNKVNSQVLISLIFGDKLNTKDNYFGTHLDQSTNHFTRFQVGKDLRSFNLGFFFSKKLSENWMVNFEVLSKHKSGLELRTNYKFGGGKYLFRSNNMYWSVFSGISFNNENFEGQSDDRKSIESWFGSEINMFNTGDLSMQSSVFTYPSLTEKNRLRTDFKIDVRYDLPLDFYIKTGLALNYDNQAAENASSVDYI